MLGQKATPPAVMFDLVRSGQDGRLVLEHARSSGDLAVRHTVWGAQRIVLVPLSGELAATADGALSLAVAVRTAHAPARVRPAPAGAGSGAAQIRFGGSEVRRRDANLYDVAGDLTVDGVTGPAVLSVRDLGWNINGRGREHTLALSASLPREFWRWAVTARQTGWMLDHEAKLFLHTVWVPGPEMDPAA